MEGTLTRTRTLSLSLSLSLSLRLRLSPALAIEQTGPLVRALRAAGHEADFCFQSLPTLWYLGRVRARVGL